MDDSFYQFQENKNIELQKQKEEQLKSNITDTRTFNSEYYDRQKEGLQDKYYAVNTWMQEENVPDATLDKRIADAYKGAMPARKLSRRERYKARKEYKEKLKNVKALKEAEGKYYQEMSDFTSFDDIRGNEEVSKEQMVAMMSIMKSEVGYRNDIQTFGGEKMLKSLMESITMLTKIDMSRFEYKDDADFIKKYSENKKYLTAGMQLKNAVASYMRCGGALETAEENEIMTRALMFEEIEKDYEMRKERIMNPAYLMIRSTDQKEMDGESLRGDTLKLYNGLQDENVQKSKYGGRGFAQGVKIKGLEKRMKDAYIEDRYNSLLEEKNAYQNEYQRINGYRFPGENEKLEEKILDKNVSSKGYLSDRYKEPAYLIYCSRYKKNLNDVLNEEDIKNLRSVTEELKTNITEGFTYESTVKMLKESLNGMLQLIRPKVNEDGSIDMPMEHAIGGLFKGPKESGKSLAQSRMIAYYYQCFFQVMRKYSNEIIEKVFEDVSAEEMEMLSEYTNVATDIYNMDSPVRELYNPKEYDDDALKSVVNGMGQSADRNRMIGHTLSKHIFGPEVKKVQESLERQKEQLKKGEKPERLYFMDTKILSSQYYAYVSLMGADLDNYQKRDKEMKSEETQKNTKIKENYKTIKQGAINIGGRYIYRNNGKLTIENF